MEKRGLLQKIGLSLAIGIPVALGVTNTICYVRNMNNCRDGVSVEMLMARDLREQTESNLVGLLDPLLVPLMMGTGQKASYYHCADYHSTGGK